MPDLKGLVFQALKCLCFKHFWKCWNLTLAQTLITRN